MQMFQVKIKKMTHSFACHPNFNQNSPSFSQILLILMTSLMKSVENNMMYQILKYYKGFVM